MLARLAESVIISQLAIVKRAREDASDLLFEKMILFSVQLVSDLLIVRIFCLRLLSLNDYFHNLVGLIRRLRYSLAQYIRWTFPSFHH